ncbi:Disease resistance protein L6, partial [Linum perenne]
RVGNKARVLPIFYYVDPRDVRHQDGPYKEPFEHHTQNHNPNIVKEWREALQEVGKMKGWHLTESSRDKRVLELFLNQFELYEVKEMNFDYSLQLFNKHAFQMDYPWKEFEILSQEIINMAAGLPLALKVLGSLLYNRDIKFWEEKLVELRKIPCTSDRVQETLKISYNELSQNEKRMFLDISCCFVGEDKNCPLYMWKDCDLYPESGIKTLLLRALINIDEKNKFWMHDHIRDLGRAIVVMEDVENPCNRSIIWSNVDAVNLLKDGKTTGTNVVEMMKVDLGDEYKLTNKDFNNLKGLRYPEISVKSLQIYVGFDFDNV